VVNTRKGTNISAIHAREKKMVPFNLKLRLELFSQIHADPVSSLPLLVLGREGRG